MATNALAMTTADGEAVPASSKPPREDDAPFVPGEVEIVGEEEVHSGIPSLKPPASAKPASDEPAPATEIVPASDAMPPAGPGRAGLLFVAAAVGLIVIGYVYLSTR